MNNTLSIIIPSWNTADITCQCIESIHRYLKSLQPEIIIVDNASTDNSVLKIRNLISTLKIANCKLTINSKNLGFSKANNIGAKTATGRFLLFLNSDMKLVDDSLVKMVNYLAKHPQIGCIGPKFLNPDLSPQASVFPPQTPINAFREFWLHQKNAYSKYLPTKLSYPWAISGGAILISRQLFIQIGGWDERYSFYFEDLELCHQIRKLNLKICYFPRARLIHHHGVSGQKITDAANQWRRLVLSSKIYHGLFEHYLLFFITWTRRQWQKLTRY